MNMTSRNLTIGIMVAVMMFGLPYFITSMWENLDAHEIMVVQSPMSGDLVVFTDPGIKYQGFGKVTKYPRRAQYDFVGLNSKKLRFNDGGHANLSGGVSWEMPLASKEVVAIHKTFGSADGVQQAAVGKMIDSAVYLAGPLMSSTESSGERRSELVQYINDQAENGVYVTTVKEKEVVDPITNQKKLVSVTVIEHEKDGGQPKRQQGSILAAFNIKLLPMSISDLKYDDIVENQIKQRQEATTQVQIAIAQSKTAEQQKLTIEAKGAATAAQAKWEQETIKAKMVTEAQQKLEVAVLGAKEALQWKQEQILRGEGEAERKRLVMNADGALQPKLDTVLEVHKVWAEAYAKNTTQQVPSIVMGGGNSQGSSTMNNVQTLMEIVGAKAAHDFAVDLGVSGKQATSGRNK